MNLNVREMQLDDIEKIVDYFHESETAFLEAMGVDKRKLPDREQWIEKLKAEYNKKLEDKELYYIIWLLDDEPIGHSNISKIKYGNSATMHLHIWKNDKRKKRFGLEFLKRTIPMYFEKYELKKLICEPYSKNIAPNKVLQKAGFTFIRSYDMIPGPLNFYQTIHRYELSAEGFENLFISE